MIGVRFTKPVRPYGAGDTALLPDDAARAVVDAGDAELYEFPAAPHAVGAADREGASSSTKVMEPALAAKPGRPATTYRTKGR